MSVLVSIHAVYHIEHCIAAEFLQKHPKKYVGCTQGACQHGIKMIKQSLSNAAQTAIKSNTGQQL